MTSRPGTMAYAKGFIDRLDQVVVEGMPLAAHRVAERYDFTPFYRLWDLYRVQRATAPRSDAISTGKHAHPLTLLVILGLSILSFLYHVIRRPKIVLYAIDKLSSFDHDHDARLEGVYRYLHKYDIRFVELMHTMPAESFWPNLIARQRVPVYFEATNILFSLTRRFRSTLVTIPNLGEVDLTSFEVEERELARRLIEERFVARARSAFQIRMFTHLLRFLRPAACFLIDDAKYYGELLAACELRGIPSYTFQHGHFTEYHVGFLSTKQGTGEVPTPTTFFVWSQYWKDRLQTLGTYLSSERIQIGGILRPIPDSISEPSLDASLHVLVPYETVAPKGEVREALAVLLADERVRIYFKVRKDTSRERQLTEYALLPSERVLVIDDIRLAPRIDVVLGTYSTFLYDMIAYGYPIALLTSSSDYGAAMVQSGLAHAVGEAGYEHLVTDLQTVASLSTTVRRTTRDTLYGATPVLLSDTLEKLGNDLSL